MDQGGLARQSEDFLWGIRSLVDDYPGLTHTWRFAVGAVWAMGRYYAVDAMQPPQDVPESAYVEDTKKNVDALIRNEAINRDWERGFWFNAAIMRLDALWERVFKFLADGRGDGPSLYSMIQPRCRTLSGLDYGNSSFGQVRKIVNGLKHEIGGVDPSVREDRELPVQMMKDLLAVIRDKVFITRLESLGKGSVITGCVTHKRQRAGS